MKTEMNTHDHDQHGPYGEYGEHGHGIDSLEIVGAIARVGMDAKEYRDKYYSLLRRLHSAIGTCSKCDDCWGEWGDHDGSIPEAGMVEIVEALVDALPGMPDRLDRFVNKGCTATYIRELLHRHSADKQEVK